MINIVAILKIKDQQAFDEFETKAISILKSHNGQLSNAFESKQHEKTEVHIIQFPSMSEFTQYKQDPALEALAELRSRAIESTDVYISDKIKKYQ